MSQGRGRYVLALALIILSLALAACRGESVGPALDASPALAQASDRSLAGDATVSTGPDPSFSLSEYKGDVVILYFSFPG